MAFDLIELNVLVLQGVRYIEEHVCNTSFSEFIQSPN